MCPEAFVCVLGGGGKGGIWKEMLKTTRKCFFSVLAKSYTIGLTTHHSHHLHESAVTLNSFKADSIYAFPHLQS